MMESIRFSSLCFLIAGCLGFGLAATSMPEENERNAPLIMESADRFEGFRSRGEYVLSGKVRFRHGEMRVETEKAVWLKDRNFLYCESGMRVTRRGSLLTSDRGTYDKAMGQATAEGNVFMRDSSGEVMATGKSLVYLRFRHLATLTGSPEIRRIYARKDSLHPPSAESVPAPAPGSAAPLRGSPSAGTAVPAGKTGLPPGGDASASDGTAGRAAPRAGPDTLSIRGEVMTYNDSSRVAVSDGKVIIHRDNLNIACGKAEYHEVSDSLYLLGDPVVDVDDSRVKGRIMRIGMRGEEIKSLLVKGEAQAKSFEPATDSSAARQSDVDGDSLFLVFREKAIDSVQVFRNAKGAYFETDRPEFVNRMSGDYMVLRFAGKQVASANVVGGAKSTYFHFEKKRLKGKNDAEGEAIDFAFKNGKIDEVMVKGRAKGTYFGEKQKKAAPRDSAEAGPAAPEPADPGTAVPPARRN